jgi:hypothetical protein
MLSYIWLQLCYICMFSVCTSYSYFSFCHSYFLGLGCAVCLVSYPFERPSPLLPAYAV